MTIYNYLCRYGHIPEDCVGKKIIDLYKHPEFGLCIGAYNNLLASQSKINDEKTEAAFRVMDSYGELKRLFGAISIDKLKPVKSIELTSGILFMTPQELLDYIILLLKTNHMEGSL